MELAFKKKKSFANGNLNDGRKKKRIVQQM